MDSRTAGLLTIGAAALGALAGLIAAPRLSMGCPPCSPEGDSAFLEDRGQRRRSIAYELVSDLDVDNDEWPWWRAIQDLPPRVIGAYEEWTFQRKIETLVNERVTSDQLRELFARHGFIYQSRAEALSSS